MLVLLLQRVRRGGAWVARPHVHFVTDVDLVATEYRLVAHAFDDFANVVDPGPARRFDLDDVEMAVFGESHELATLPATIARLEAARDGLEAVLAAPDVYRDGGAKAQETSAKLEKIRAAIAAAEERWLTLEALRETLDAQRTGT